jgi:hypothetical protein
MSAEVEGNRGEQELPGSNFPAKTVLVALSQGAESGPEAASSPYLLPAHAYLTSYSTNFIFEKPKYHSHRTCYGLYIFLLFLFSSRTLHRIMMIT